MPTRKAIASKINNLFETEKPKLQNKLNRAEFISLIGNFWTSVANDSYFSITAHWIDDSWTFESTILQIEKCAR